MDKKLELFNNLKQQQFIEKEEEMPNLMMFVKYTNLNNKEAFIDLRVFWEYLKSWFTRNEIINIFSISTPTFYALNKYITTGVNKNVSEKLEKRVELFYNLLKGYVENE